MNKATQQPRSRLAKYTWRGLAAAFLALAAAGAVLPVLPTTPFVIVAAWAAGKSSPELHERLRRHPRYGPALVAWQDHGAVSRGAKAAAVTLMMASWGLVWWTAGNVWMPVVVGIVLCTVGGYLVTRPNPPKRDTTIPE